jgi:hypothetical protein
MADYRQQSLSIARIASPELSKIADFLQHIAPKPIYKHYI